MGREPSASAWLVEKVGPRPNRQHPLKMGVTTIGQAGDNDIAIGESTVSRHHAKIFLEDEKFYILDLGSRNGTMVNGKDILKHDLIDNDVIDLGEAQFVFKST